MKKKKKIDNVEIVEELPGTTTKTTLEDTPIIDVSNDVIISKKDVNTKKLETLEELLNNLRNKYTFGNLFLYKDVKSGEYVSMKNDRKDQLELEEFYDKSSIRELIISMVKVRQNINELEFFPLTKKTIDSIKNSIQGVKKKFDRDEEEFYISNYCPTLNMFKRTELNSFIVEDDERIEYNILEDILKTRFKRLNILLENNIGKEKEINWFLNWVSLEMNDPRITKTTFMLIGEQGSGKTFLIKEMFENNIYDKFNVSTLDNESMGDSFNDIYTNKSFVVFNEVSTMDMKSNNLITQTLKRLITDDSLIVRGMRKTRVEQKITFNCCVTTNSLKPLKIENKDRRWSVFGVGLPLIGHKKVLELCEENKEDFNKFMDNLKIEIKEFLFYVKKLKYDSSVSLEPIETPLKIKIINTTNTKEDTIGTIFNTKDSERLMEYLKTFEESFRQEEEDLILDEIDYRRDYKTKNEFVTDISIESDIRNQEDWLFNRIKLMFENGIFTNHILFTIYKVIFNIDINDFNLKSVERKSGIFWNQFFTTLKKSQMKFKKRNFKDVNLSIKVFSEDDLDNKKLILKTILEFDSDVIPF